MTREAEIYLDHNATTPLDLEVAAAMREALHSFWGNASSVHRRGQEVRALLCSAQHAIARVLAVLPQQIVFTSGATEAINMVLRGICATSNGGHLLSSSAEHAATLSTLADLGRSGYEVTLLSPDSRGAVAPEQIAAAIRSDTRLLAFMAANNETGVKSDLTAIALLAEEHGLPFLVDGVALLGKASIPKLPGTVIWCFSAHKIHGPQGAGITLLPPNMRLRPLITGGAQQQGRRGGTENLLAVIGMAKAFSLLEGRLTAFCDEMLVLRNYFEAKLLKALPAVYINGEGERVANTSNLAFEGVDGESLLYLLDQQGIEASMGSACSSGALEPSHVLLAMGYPRVRALASLRFSFARTTTREELEIASDLIINTVRKLRGLPQ